MNIKVKTTLDNTEYLFQRSFNSAVEDQVFMDRCVNKRRIGLFESLVITVRTDNFNNFCKDFFLPGLINHALRINDMAPKIIFSIVFTIIDIYTLLLRVITIIPRYFYNAANTKETHPLYRYLVANGVNEEHLAAGHVYFEYEYKEGRRGVGDGLVTHGETFNFIQLPETASSISSFYSWHGGTGIAKSQKGPQIEALD